MKAMVVRCDPDLEYYKITSLLLKAFAKKWHCAYIEITGSCDLMTIDNKPHWKILQAKELLNQFDRLLLIDADIIITPHCLNPFEIIPETMIGTIYEDVGSRMQYRRQIIKDIQKDFGEINWTQGYLNCGFFLLSKIHKVIFEPINEKYWIGFGSDDVHFGYQINKNNLKVLELPYYWNHMSMFSESWNGSPCRYNSYVIHYAGQANFPDKGDRSRDDLIKDDFNLIYNK